MLEAGAETFVHDANGNMVERKGPKGVTRYTYDAEDRLVKVVLPNGAEVSYGYAPTGERVWRRDTKGLTWFVISELNVAAELDEALKPKAAYTLGPGIDHPVVMVRDGQEYFYHADVLGSIAALTDKSGVRTASYDYDAFGVPKVGSGPLPNLFTYTGREYDAASGLYFYRARYYDPKLGRFLTRDPIEGQADKVLSLNSYCYVLNAPLTHTDPLGTEPFRINLLTNRSPYAPASLPEGLDPNKMLFHFSSRENIDNIKTTRRFRFGTRPHTRGEVHFTERGQPTGIGEPQSTEAGIQVRAGDMAERGARFERGRQPGSWIARQGPGQRNGLRIPPSGPRVDSSRSDPSSLTGVDQNGVLEINTSDSSRPSSGPSSGNAGPEHSEGGGGNETGGTELPGGSIPAAETSGRSLWTRPITGKAARLLRGLGYTAAGAGVVLEIHTVACSDNPTDAASEAMAGHACGYAAGVLASPAGPLASLFVGGLVDTAGRTIMISFHPNAYPVEPGPLTSCQVPEIPPPFDPRILELVFGVIGNPGNIPETMVGPVDDKQIQDLARSLDQDLTTIANAQRLDRALTDQERARFAADLARYQAALQQAAQQRIIIQRRPPVHRQGGHQGH